MSAGTRGGCLATLLVAWIILNGLSALYYLLAADSLLKALPSFPAWAIPVFALGGLLNVLFAIGVWRWRRWGIYGIVVTNLLASLVNLAYVGVLGALIGIVGLVLLLLLIRPHWSAMH